MTADKRRALHCTVLLVGVLIVSAPGTAAAQDTTLTLTPDEGAAGSSVTVTGSGFDSCGDPGVVVADPDGEPSTSPPPDAAEVGVYWDDGTLLIIAPVEEDGSFGTSITVPAGATGGEYQVSASCDGASGSATFTVQEPPVETSAEQPTDSSPTSAPAPTSAAPPVPPTDPSVPTDLLVGVPVLLVLLALAGLLARRLHRRAAPSITVTTRPLLSDPPVLRETGSHPTFGVRLQAHLDPGIQTLHESGR